MVGRASGGLPVTEALLELGREADLSLRDASQIWVTLAVCSFFVLS